MISREQVINCPVNMALRNIRLAKTEQERRECIAEYKALMKGKTMA